ncbi:MAG: hypothetical protein HRU16_08250 [Planctomycetes bacterium]|nr:hypothetical protein [Planctomycetota bacterium]
MTKLLLFLLMTAMISLVHVSVTRIEERQLPLKKEAVRYFLSVGGGIVILALIVQFLSMAFQ